MSVESTDPARSYAAIFNKTGFFPSTGAGSATGGTLITDGGYSYNVFITSGSLEVSGTLDAEVLIVAGGGAGGGIYYAGGGGAGGVVHGTPITITSGTHPLTVGTGGASPTTTYQQNSGTDSTFTIDGTTITAKGGGAGGSYSGATAPGDPGGSSGGNSGYAPTGPIAAAPQPVPVSFTAYGNAGGTGGGYGGGGGGGSGAAGASAPGSTGANGGDGQPFPGFPAPVIAPAIPAPVRSAWTTAVGPTGYYAGGGGGANYYTTGGRSSGGLGGGGKGHGTYPNPSLNAEPGIEYTGSGGGGSNYNPGDGGGGDGIIIVKWAS